MNAKIKTKRTSNSIRTGQKKDPKHSFDSVALAILHAMNAKRLPGISGINLDVFSTSKAGLNGCVYDVLKLSDEMLAFTIINVIGRGSSAAMLACYLRSFISRQIFQVHCPRIVLERANEELIKHFPPGCRAMVCVAYINMHDNQFVYASAGDSQVSILHKQKGETRELQGTCNPLGEIRKPAYEDFSIYLTPEDWLFLYNSNIRKVFPAAKETSVPQWFGRLVSRIRNDPSPEKVVQRFRRLYAQQDPRSQSLNTSIITVEILNESQKVRLKKILGFKKDDKVYVQFISYYEEMEQAAAIILRAMDSYGYRDEDIRKMKIVLNELMANGIGHGNNENHSKKIVIGHKIDTQSAEVAILDEGKGFRPGDVPDPTLPENLIRDRGRGLYIVGKYVDTLDFNKRGNRVKISKRHHLASK